MQLAEKKIDSNEREKKINSFTNSKRAQRVDIVSVVIRFGIIMLHTLWQSARGPIVFYFNNLHLKREVYWEVYVYAPGACRCAGRRCIHTGKCFNSRYRITVPQPAKLAYLP